MSEDLANLYIKIGQWFNLDLVTAIDFTEGVRMEIIYYADIIHFVIV